MKVVRITLITTILVFILSSLTSAQSWNTTVQIQFGSGGRTIGGPAAFSGSATTLGHFFSTSRLMPLDVCLTVGSINGTTHFQFNGINGSVIEQVTVPSVGVPTTTTVCDPGVVSIQAQCVNNSPCGFVWRIDKAD